MDNTDNNSNLHSSMLKDSASKSKFDIKFKIPTPTKEEEEEEDGSGHGGSSTHNIQPHGHIVCESCGKTFTSGQAWGGHKRHHKKSKRIKEISNNSIKIKKYSSSAGGSGGSGSNGSSGGSKIDNRRGCNMIKAGDVIMGSDGKPTSRQCGKVLGSLNSLYGHMRSHPWNGIQSSPTSNSPAEDFPFGRSRFGLNQNPNQNQICSGPDDVKNIDLLSCLSSGWSKRDRRGRAGLSGNSIPQAARSLLKLSRDMAHVTEEKEEEEEEMESCFRCNICEKTFSSSQALGGHKSWHRKFPAGKAPPPV